MQDLSDVLLKRALGYTVSETTAEYAVDEQGNRRKIKERVTSHDVPPDLQALKTYLDWKGKSPFDALSDEELEGEKQRLLAQLAAQNAALAGQGDEAEK